MSNNISIATQAELASFDFTALITPKQADAVTRISTLTTEPGQVPGSFVA